MLCPRWPASLLFTRRSALRGAAGLALGSLLPAAEEPVVIQAGGSSIEVAFAGEGFALSQDAILNWVRQCARAVSTYLGQFPVPRAHVRILTSNRNRGVGGGKSWAGPEAQCQIAIGKDATVANLNRDWVLTHEMFHFAFPSVADRHNWIEEGISTYTEPIARAGIGIVSPEEVWNDMIRDMPQGLPGQGDGGLDETHTWGRTYWGGALFCLQADIGIRKATKNRLGLSAALRAINAAGGNITAEWPLTRALGVGDRGTGTTVLADLYRKMGSSPSPVDLAALWNELGVSRADGRVTFDDNAPLAAIRKSIL